MKRLVTALLLLPFFQIPAFAQAPDPAGGKALWEGNNTFCKNCHGKNGEGAFGPDLAGRGLSAAQFQQAVRKPWGVMPTFVEDQVSDARATIVDVARQAGVSKSTVGTTRCGRK